MENHTVKQKHYDVLIVGGGISGTALFYELAKYTDVKSLCLLEKYEALSTLNSKGKIINTKIPIFTQIYGNKKLV